MALNTSEAGYIAPSSSVAYGDDLDDILQAAIVGITGIAGNLVRPRWQPEPPQQPAFTVNWVAFGIVRVVEDVFAYEGHDAASDSSEIQRDELLHVLHSFYGPNCHALCARFRDGMSLAQNRVALRAAHIELHEVGETANLPALLKEKWVKRIDVTVIYRRRTARTYPVLTIQSGQVGLDNEHYVTPINVTLP